MVLPQNANSVDSRNTDSETTAPPSDTSTSITDNAPKSKTTSRDAPKKSGINLRVDSKILILGDYKTGKTTFARHVISILPRAIVWDPRGDVFREGVSTLTAAQAEYEKTGKAVYHPGRGDIGQKFEDFCEWTLTLHNTMIFIDEPSMVAKSGTMPDVFSDLHRLGHARGLGVTVATHSVWDLPHVTHQADDYFVFRINRLVERNALGQMMTPAAMEWIPTAPQYHFWHHAINHDGPVNPIQPKKEVRKNASDLQGTSGGGLPTMRTPPPK